jgi:F5/8 type C domain
MKTTLIILFVFASIGLQAQNIALNKPVKVSSLENNTYLASWANDGNLLSRWSSLHYDSQWILIDLGSSYNISGVKITWETAYATSYEIKASNDTVNWVTIYSTTTNTSLINNIILSGTGRYVKLNLIKRATSWGFSLYEFEVYGTIPLPSVSGDKYKATCDSFNSVISGLKTQISQLSQTILNYTDQLASCNSQNTNLNIANIMAIDSIKWYKSIGDSLQKTINAYNHNLSGFVRDTDILTFSGNPIELFAFPNDQFNSVTSGMVSRFVKLAKVTDPVFQIWWIVKRNGYNYEVRYMDTGL